MKLSEIKNHLQSLDTIAFQLPNGELVAPHFHVTEVGKVVKDFIDCGGKVRTEAVINFQLWEENDYNHRLHPEKLVNIIELSEKLFKFDDLDIEVEYQGKETIGKYDLDFDGTHFLLISKLTACLARETCGISEEKSRVPILEKSTLRTCEPNTGCC
jgi:superfamily II helicase